MLLMLLYSGLDNKGKYKLTLSQIVGQGRGIFGKRSFLRVKIIGKRSFLGVKFIGKRSKI